MKKSEKQLSFGKELCRLIKEAKITQTEFYKAIGITKSYFYDISSGKTNPPPAELQIRMIEFLKPCKEDRALLFELAGRERNETPVDIAWYLVSHEQEKSMIREQINYSALLKSGGSYNVKED